MWAFTWVFAVRALERLLPQWGCVPVAGTNIPSRTVQSGAGFSFISMIVGFLASGAVQY